MLLVFVQTTDDGEIEAPVGVVKTEGVSWGTKNFDPNELDMDEKDAKELKKMIAAGDATIMTGVRFVNVDETVSKKLFKKSKGEEKQGKKSKGEEKQGKKTIEKKKGKKSKKDGDGAEKSKRVKTGYQLFCDAVRPGVIEKGKEESKQTGEPFRNQDVMKEMGRMWKELSESERDAYNQTSTTLKQEAASSSGALATTAMETAMQETPTLQEAMEETMEETTEE